MWINDTVGLISLLLSAIVPEAIPSTIKKTVDLGYPKQFKNLLSFMLTPPPEDVQPLSK